MSAASPGTDALRAIAGAVAGIGGDLNRIARVADAAIIKGEPPAPQLGALAEAAAALDQIGAALRRALAVEGVGEPP
jgi:hypothetical protein